MKSADLLIGNWRTVKIDDQGMQSISNDKAKEIEKSVLRVEKNKISFAGANFIDSCVFFRFNLKPYDTESDYAGLRILYTDKELSSALWITAVDKDDNFCCYNDCNLFVLKEDTLINICGGYTYFRVKCVSQKKS